MGGWAGFSQFRPVSWMRGRAGLAESRSLQAPSRPRICKMTSSRLGW